MTPRRRGTRGGKRKKGRIVGLAILTLAAGGIWLGSQWVDDEGDLSPARTLPASSGTTSDDAALTPAPPPIPEVGNRIRVEVLNAGGVRGAAAQARDALRTAGFDVVLYGNASRSDLEQSEVMLRAGSEEAAHAVARALGIPVVRVAPDSTLLVEVTVLLGSKWASDEWIQRRLN
jgi:hypothetical protein